MPGWVQLEILSVPTSLWVNQMRVPESRARLAPFGVPISGSQPLSFPKVWPTLLEACPGPSPTPLLLQEAPESPLHSMLSWPGMGSGEPGGGAWALCLKAVKPGRDVMGHQAQGACSEKHRRWEVCNIAFWNNRASGCTLVRTNSATNYPAPHPMWTLCQPSGNWIHLVLQSLTLYPRGLQRSKGTCTAHTVGGRGRE